MRFAALATDDDETLADRFGVNRMFNLDKPAQG
jgi:hypothetical protein